ncbi:hypothetical protein B0T18DRAFT_316489 [Schizothecium vesticola]|uniref:Uncharacterized protein n=1 Tax=Schizothecium vesticola TaxID=314040 RepID=A0AA40F9A3_9PEZI|nr:hypothetical protein B0T18DRAFT_316489 [Schizothecium vesticola]
MTSQNPATPIKVPASAANYTMATLDPELRTQINQALIDDGLVTKIQDHLLHSLHAHPANWPTAVENHAIALLRSGEVTTFPALLRRVIEDVRRDTSLAPTTNGAEANGKKSNGTPAPAAADSNGSPAAPNLALPSSVVEDALKVTRESLETVCSFAENGAS